MRSVQSSFLFLYYVSVQCNVSSVLFMCQQDSVYTVFNVSLQGRLSSIAFNASSFQSLQHQFSFLSAFSLQARVCSVHSQWCLVFESTAFVVCLLLFSVGSVQSNIQLSVGFRVYSIQCQFSVCSIQGVYCSVGHSPSVLFGVCSVQSTGCSLRVRHVSHVMFRVHTLNFLCPCAVLEF